METAIQMFKFDNKQDIRVVHGQEGDIWFVASDVCKALDISNVSDAVGRLDEDERDNIATIDVMGRSTSLVSISESGLYSLVLTSRKAEAQPFKRWVTHDVIPTIRKTGSYAIQVKPKSELDMIEAMVGWMRRKEAEDAERDHIGAEHEHRLMAVEARLTTVDEGSQYFTVLAYARIRGIKIDNKAAQVDGMRCARWSRDNGYPIGHAPDARFGSVGTYHIDALEAVFGKRTIEA